MKTDHACIKEHYDKEVGRCMALRGGGKGAGQVYDRFPYLPGDNDGREAAINSCLDSALSIQKFSVIVLMTEEGETEDIFYGV